MNTQEALEILETVLLHIPTWRERRKAREAMEVIRSALDRQQTKPLDKFAAGWKEVE